MKSINEVIQGNEAQLRQRVINSLLDTPYLLRQFEAFDKTTNDLTNHLDDVVKLLLRSPYLYL